MNCIFKGKENLSACENYRRHSTRRVRLRGITKLHLAANKDEAMVDQLDPGAKIRRELQGQHQ